MEPEITTTTTIPAGEKLFFGGSESVEEQFEGKLDEIAIYPSALSAKRIHHHYQLCK